MIQLISVSKIYQQGDKLIHAVDNVSLTIPRGAFVTLQGKSGCGKSTFLKLLALIEKPDKGTIIYKGKRVDEATDRLASALRNREIALITQDPSLIETSSVAFNILLPHYIRKEKIKPDIKQELERVSALLGISQYLKSKVSQLSGGERQRVCIARSLLSGAECILADEPTGALDTITGQSIINILSDLNRSGKTIIMVTHDREFASVGNMRLYMEDGRIKDFSRKIKHPTHHRRV